MCAISSGSGESAIGGDSASLPSYLNVFLCNAIAGTDAYRMTIERLRESKYALPYLGLLRQFQEEHELIGEVFRHLIRELGADVNDASGTLGPWADSVNCSASLFPAFGGGSTLDCLVTGEERCIDACAGDLPRLTGEPARFVRDQVLPLLRRHIRLLRGLLGEGAET